MRVRIFEVITTLFRKDNYHRIRGWKRPLRSSSPTINPTPPCLLKPHPEVTHLHVF